MLADEVTRAACPDLRALVEEAGYRPYRGFLYFCAVHEERTASARLYPNGIYCFGCHEWRDPIGLARMIMRSTAGEAIRYLARRYGIQSESPPKRGGIHPVRTSHADLISTDLIAIGLLWLAEDVLEELKRPLSESGELDSYRIRKWTRRQEQIARWSRYQAARVLTRYRRRFPVSARSLAVGPYRQQIFLARVIHSFALQEVAA